MEAPSPEDVSPRDLAAEMRRVGLEATDEQIERLDAYRRLLWEFNRRMNLTRHTTLELFVARDVLDSTVFSRALAPGEDVLDVGTGGGVPGLILAILRPDLSVSVCESVGKKADAVREIVRQLGLDVSVERDRGENLLAGGATYDTLLVRAVARLEKLLGWFQPHWGTFRRMLVLKGPAWAEERAAARHKGLLRGLDLRRRETYRIPGTDAESVLLELRAQ